MSGTIKAVFEDGVFRPLEKVELPEREEVSIVILQKDDDLPAMAIYKLALSSGRFDFLSDPAEDVYTVEDGEPV